MTPKENEFWTTNNGAIFYVKTVIHFESRWSAIIIWEDGHISTRNQDNWPGHTASLKFISPDALTTIAQSSQRIT